VTAKAADAFTMSADLPDGMVVIPCSIRTLGSIAHGYGIEIAEV
jgi:3-polyprenyl-4-hydroxybenzoate decarboxylase